MTILDEPVRRRKYMRDRYQVEHARLQLAAILAKGGRCVDCGFADLTRPEVFDFDHLPGTTKLARLSLLLRGYSQQRIDEELAKCELVCSNCHRTRTKQRANTAGE